MIHLYKDIANCTTELKMQQNQHFKKRICTLSIFEKTNSNLHEKTATPTATAAFFGTSTATDASQRPGEKHLPQRLDRF